MTVRVEVPPGHKFCKCCGGVFPIEIGFRLKTKVYPVTGKVTVYAASLCRSCEYKTKTKKPKAAKPVKLEDPAPKPWTNYWPRQTDESRCDKALESWPVIERGRLVPCLGVSA
jgi:hypothetical protein